MWPDKFEFPACNACNNGTSKHDTIFGFHSMLVDFNDENRTAADLERLKELRDEIARRYPDALPDPDSRVPIFRAGRIITPRPVAISVGTTPALREAMGTIGDKLAHALFYREMESILSADHRFFASWIQIQRYGADQLTDFFKGLLPDLRIGQRTNIKKYGSRFAYMSGCKPDDDFFVFAAQFGYGLMCWGMVLGPAMNLSESNDALQKMNWQNGGGGLGAESAKH
jgi:hypothetical protein